MEFIEEHVQRLRLTIIRGEEIFFKACNPVERPQKLVAEYREASLVIFIFFYVKKLGVLRY